MSPGDTLALLIVVGIPVVAFAFLLARWIKMRERKIEVEAGLAVEKAAQYAARTHELEQRVRVLEQIVTDGGAQTAAQIEALRDRRVPVQEDARS